MLSVSAQTKSLSDGVNADTYNSYLDSAYDDYYSYNNQDNQLPALRERMTNAKRKPIVQYPKPYQKPATTTQKPYIPPVEAESSYYDTVEPSVKPDKIVHHMHFHMNGPPDNFIGDYSEGNDYGM